MPGVDRLFCSWAKFTSEIVLRAAKNLSKNLGFVFWFFSQKQIKLYCFLTNLCPKTGKYILKVCYRGRKKNFGGPQFGHAWSMLTSSVQMLGIRSALIRSSIKKIKYYKKIEKPICSNWFQLFIPRLTLSLFDFLIPLSQSREKKPSSGWCWLQTYLFFSLFLENGI
jgi:hypothetical protein